MCGHVWTDPRPLQDIAKLKDNVQLWMKDHNIRGFYLVNQSSSFEQGAKNCITMAGNVSILLRYCSIFFDIFAGLGKLSPNMLLIGFKSDWKQNLNFAAEYLNTMYCAFDQRLSVTILRVKDGFDYSGAIAEEKTEVKVRALYS